MVYNWQQWLFPATCLICGAAGHDNLDICPDCLDKLPLNQHFCPCCALPLQTQSPQEMLCGQCSQQRPAYSHIVAPWLYQAPVDDLIQQLKFHQKLATGRLLGQLFARKLSTRKLPEMLLPMPLYKRQLRRRGFNHASELTGFIARELDIPWSPWLLKKIRETRPQHNLRKQERKQNLKNCFSFNNAKGYRHLAIIDDVVTTGTTAQEAAKTLTKAGVAQVEIWSLTRTPIETYRI